MEVLNFRNRNIGDDGARALSTALIHENNKVTTLTLLHTNIGYDGARSLSTALMNENNKATELIFWNNRIGDDGVSALSIALMNVNNKLTTLDVIHNKIGDNGVSALSMALMNENNKVTTLDLSFNNIGTQGLAALVKSLRFSLVSHLEIGYQRGLNDEVQTGLERFTRACNKYLARLVCLASVRTISRIGDQSPHFRELSSDILIRVVQTLGWFIGYQETLRMLEEHVENEK